MADKRHIRMVELETKPDFEKAMDRIYAWYENEIIDRTPIRFSSHNEQNEQIIQDKKGINLWKIAGSIHSIRLKSTLKLSGKRNSLQRPFLYFSPISGPKYIPHFMAERWFIVKSLPTTFQLLRNGKICKVIHPTDWTGN